jgi:hypothetical protein
MAQLAMRTHPALAPEIEAQRRFSGTKKIPRLTEIMSGLIFGLWQFVAPAQHGIASFNCDGILRSNCRFEPE